MLTLPRKFLFALEAVLYIACHTGVRPISSKEICANNGMAPRYLEPIMQPLVRANILRGVRGPRGGYFLARERRKIPVLEIFQLVAKMEQEEKDSLSLLGNAVVIPLWAEFEGYISAQLGNITLEDLCKQAEEKGVMAHIRNAADFVI